MLTFNSLGDVYDNKECRKQGWIYVFKRKHHIKVGRTSRTIIERLNQHKVNGEFFDIVCFKTDYDRIYERVILAYIRNIKYEPIEKNEYFDLKNYDEIVSIIQSIFKLSFTCIAFVYDYYRSKNKDRNNILKKIFDVDWMKKMIKDHKIKEYEEDEEETEISSIEYSETEEAEEKIIKPKKISLKQNKIVCDRTESTETMSVITLNTDIILSLIERTKQLTRDLENILTMSNGSRPIIIAKPIHILQNIKQEIDNWNDYDPYTYLIKLSDTLIPYEKSGEKIGNDFKHLFESLFILICKKLLKVEKDGCIGLNTVFLSNIVKVRDIKWLLNIIAIYHGSNLLFKFNNTHLETYAKIGSRDCQNFIHKLACELESYSTFYKYILQPLFNSCDLEKIKYYLTCNASIYMCYNDSYCSHTSHQDCYTYSYAENEDYHYYTCFEKKLRHEKYLISEWTNLTNPYETQKRCECIMWLMHEFDGKIKFLLETEKNKMSDFIDHFFYEKYSHLLNGN